MAKKISVSEDTLNFHAEYGDELVLDKNGIAIFDCMQHTPSRFLKIYINGVARLKWVPDLEAAYKEARQLQFEDLEAEAASALGA